MPWQADGVVKYPIHRVVPRGRLLSFTACLLLGIFLAAQPLLADTYLDQFNTQAYNNSDGTTDWSASPWQETGEADGATTGDLQVVTNGTNYWLRVQGASKGFVRQADLTGATSATLSFDYQGNINAPGETVVIEIYNNGTSSWDTLATYDRNTGTGSLSQDITSYIAANTQIRFLSNASFDATDQVYFDNVQIQYTMPAPTPTHFAVSHDGNGDICTAEAITITRHNTSHAVDTAYAGTITLTTSTAHGDWTGYTGSGTLVNSGGGNATYAYAPADNGQVVLALANTTAETLNINISDGTYSEDASEDNDLIFASTNLETYRDECNSVSYTGSNGSLDWSTTPWQEINEADGAGAGDIQVLNESGSNRLRIQNAGKGVQRQADTSTGTAGITLTYNYKRNIPAGGPGRNVTVDISTGAGWTNLATYSKGSVDTAYQAAAIDISAYASATMQIRFVGDASFRNTDQVYFDNIQIENHSPLSCGNAVKLQILVPGETAAPGTPTGKTGTPVDQIQGVSFTVTVNAVDASWNVISSNVDTVAISSSDGAATLPANTTLVNGTATLSVTLNSLGSFTVTASDVTDAGVTADTSPAITVSQANRRFNAFETGTAAGATTGVINTKIAGSLVTLSLVALNNAGALNTTYNKAVTVELLDSSDNSAVADSKGCRGSWTTIQTLAPNPQFTMADNGRITISFTENEAYADTRLRITENPVTMGCSEDNFAIRPNSFIASVTDTDWTSAGTGRTLNNTALANTTLTHKAGRPLTITATAVNALTNTTTNYTANPDALSLTACAGTGCTTSFGTLEPGTWSTAAGVATAGAAVYSEVGAFTLTLEDRTFADVDIADSTTTQRYIVAPALEVGRFVPDYFDITLAATPILADNCSALTPFTYLGEPFGYAVAPKITITAKNASGGTTRNYEGSFWRLGPADPVTYTLNYAYSDSVAPTLIGPTSGAAGADKSNCNGALTVTLNDTFTYTRPAETSPYSPFAASIDLTIAAATDLTDSDGVCYTSACTDLGITGIIGASLRHGLLQVANNFGPETEDLIDSPLATLYYDGTDWVTNTDDSCTAAPPLTLCDTLLGGRIAGIQTKLAGGAGAFTVTTAGTAGEKLTVCATGPAWLTDDACAAPHTTCGEISFGLFRGNDRIINWQEISR